MADAFVHHSSGLDSPASYAAAITPNDATNLADVPRALYCTGAGIVRVTMRGGGAAVDLPMLAGVALPVRVSRVWYTGTTATGIVGVW